MSEATVSTVSNEDVLSALLSGVSRLSEKTTAAVEASNAASAGLQNLTTLVEEVRASGSSGFPGNKAEDGTIRVQLAGTWWTISPTGKPRREG